MLTIFDFLNDIICYKRGDLLKSIDDEQLYIPYMLSRWISFSSSQNCKVINNTVNRYWPILQQKQDHYKFLVGVIPQSSNRRIAYIKKIKPEKEKDFTPVIALVAKNLNLSIREVTNYVEQVGLDLEPYMKALKTAK